MEYRQLPIARRLNCPMSGLDIPSPGTVLLAVRPFSGEAGGSHRLLQETAAPLLQGAVPTLEQDSQGKPYFPDCPQLHFNLSHSGDLWVCAFAREPVGLDIQQQDNRRWEALAIRYFHPREVQLVRARGAAAFFDVWSAKESYLKYLGCGLRRPLNCFSTVAEDGSFPALPDVCLTQISLRPGCSLFLCTEKQPENILRL